MWPLTTFKVRPPWKTWQTWGIDEAGVKYRAAIIDELRTLRTCDHVHRSREEAEACQAVNL